MLDLANGSCSNVEQAESLTELLSISSFFHINFLNFLKSTFLTLYSTLLSETLQGPKPAYLQ